MLFIHAHRYRCRPFSPVSNDAVITTDLMRSKIVTETAIPDAAIRDLVLSTITVKYTQVRGPG